MGTVWRRVLVGILVGGVSLLGSVPAQARPGRAEASSGPEPDFDGDGYADLAIGVPREGVAGIRGGAVHVLYGSAGGLQAGNDQIWTQDSPDIPDQMEGGDNFGWSLATGDFDGDGFSDLAVGARYEAVGEVRASGSVTIIRGSRDGLTADASQLWHQGVKGILDRPEPWDQYGWSLVAGDLDGDGFDDLVVGVHYEDLPCGAALCQNAGAVNILYGTQDGLRAKRNELWSQATDGIPETPGENDRFGWSLAVADFDQDGFEDLAVGAPYEDYLHHRDGLVHVIRGSAGGLTSAGTQLWSQGSPGIPDEPYLREQFGQSLAAGDLDGDGFGDLVVGVWFQDKCTICNEGVVHTIYGSGQGLTAAGTQLWSQDSRGILDQRDVGDQFGQSLAVDDLDGDGFDDLVVGVPWEDFTAYVHEDQGAVNVIYGTADGLRAAGNQRWSQASARILDAAERDDHLAEAIGTGDFDGDGDADLALGIAWETIDGVRSGAVAIIGGTPDGLRANGNQLWTQDSLGMEDAAESGDGFGWSLSSRLPRAGSPRVCYGNRGGPC